MRSRVNFPPWAVADPPVPLRNESVSRIPVLSSAHGDLLRRARDNWAGVSISSKSAVLIAVL